MEENIVREEYLKENNNDRGLCRCTVNALKAWQNLQAFDKPAELLVRR